MTKPILLVMLLAMSASADVGPAPTAAALPTTISPEVGFRVLHERAESWIFLLEGKTDFQNANRQLTQATLGAYYRFNPILRAGLFYKRQYGTRYDIDWGEAPSSTAASGWVWFWADTKSRGEDILIADVTPRFSLSALGAPDTAFELKTRFSQSSLQSFRTLNLRPGIFHAFSGWTLYALEELYFPLNYGTQTIYQTWSYLGAILPLNSTFQFNPYVAYETEVWNATPAFITQVGSGWTQTSAQWVTGFMLIVNVE